MEFFKNTDINKYAIELEDHKQLFYRPIYILNLMKLETLKIYIKTNLKPRFIQPSKFFISALILFNKKPNRNLCLCIGY